MFIYICVLLFIIDSLQHKIEIIYMSSMHIFQRHPIFLITSIIVQYSLLL